MTTASSVADDSYLGTPGSDYTLSDDGQLTVASISPNPIGTFTDDRNDPGSLVFTTVSGRPSGYIKYDASTNRYRVQNNDTGVTLDIDIENLDVAKKYFISTITKKDQPGGPASDIYTTPSLADMRKVILDGFPAGQLDDSEYRSKVEEVSDRLKAVSDARLKYLGSPSASSKDDYKKAAKDLIDTMYSIDPSKAKKFKFVDSRLSNRDVAEVNLHIQKKIKDAPDTEDSASILSSYNALEKKISSEFDQKIANNPTVRELLKDGKYESLSDQMDKNTNGLKNEYVSAGFAPEIAEILAKSRSLDKYSKKLSDGNRISLEFKSDMNNVVVLYFDKDLQPVATPEDVVRLRNSMTLVRRSGLNIKGETKFTLVGENSKAPGMSQVGPGDQAFSFPGGGVTLLVDRLNRDAAGISSKKGWFSTDTSDIDKLFNHIVAHETAHTVQYSLWGSDSSDDNGLAALQADFEARGLSTDDSVSSYGNDSFAEYFAEAYARYLLTGEASDEFKEMLEDKGLLRRDPTKWESSLTDAELESYEIFQKLENYPGTPSKNPNISSAQLAAIQAKRHMVDTYEIISLFGNISDGASWTTVDQLDPNAIILSRGVTPRGGLSPIQMQEAFVSDPEPWVGHGIYGHGWYFSTSWSEAAGYSNVGHNISSLDDAKVTKDFWTLQAKPEAKIAYAGDPAFSNKMNSFRRNFMDFAQKAYMERDGLSSSEAANKARTLWDMSPLDSMAQSEYAVLFGYDAVALENPIASNPADQLGTKVVVMNRSAFLLVDKRGM